MSSRFDPIVFHEPLGPVTRIIIGAFGFVPLIAPYELLIKHGAPLFAPGMVPFWFLSLSAIIVGGVFLFSALFGASRTVTVDAKDRILRVEMKGLFRLNRRWTHAFIGVKSVGVVCEQASDGPPRYAVKAQISGETRPVLVATFPDEAPAKALADRLRSIIAR